MGLSPDPSRLSAEPQRFAAAVMAARTNRQMSRVALAEQAGVSLQIIEDLGAAIPSRGGHRRHLSKSGSAGAIPGLQSFGPARAAVRKQRGLASLSRAQLAARASNLPMSSRSLEMATLWPSQEICMALLAVKSLALRSDVAAFLRTPSAEAAAEPHRIAERLPPYPGAGTARTARAVASIPGRPVLLQVQVPFESRAPRSATTLSRRSWFDPLPMEGEP